MYLISNKAYKGFYKWVHLTKKLYFNSQIEYCFSLIILKGKLSISRVLSRDIYLNTNTIL